MSLFKTLTERLARFTGSPEPKRVNPPAALPDAKVTYSSAGREGYVNFTSGASQFRLYYEFGGDKALAVVSVPDKSQWEQKTGLSSDLRDEVLDFIARQVVSDQTSSGTNRYEISDKWITIFA